VEVAVAESILTPRLELVPAVAAHLGAELDGNAALARSLGVRVPPDWPPDLYDRDAIEFFLVMATHTPEEDLPWLSYYVVLRDDPVGPVVVGIAGFKGAPQDGQVEVGYSVLAPYRRRGIASEAVEGFLRFAFADARVDRVLAETVPELIASIGVLEHCGFRYAGPGYEEGAVLYGIERAEWERGTAAITQESRRSDP
jgi:ribosomal-protein-alanine N-acetyltransferase